MIEMTLEVALLALSVVFLALAIWRSVVARRMLADAVLARDAAEAALKHLREARDPLMARMAEMIALQDELFALGYIADDLNAQIEGRR